LGAVGGSQSHTQTQAELAAHFHAAAIFDPTHTHTYNVVQGGSGLSGGGNFSIVSANVGSSLTGVRVWDGATLDQTYPTGNSTPMPILNPAAIINKIIFVGHG
jgi:hypothetical protein